MRKIVLLLLLVCSVSLFAQEQRLMPSSTTSIQNEKAKFLLFPTQNNYTFLKLNTRTGEIFMVQYSLDQKDRFELKIEYGLPLIREEDQENGRFFLYPTNNIYNFLLLDQIDGRVWQVQWGTKEEYRFYKRIYDIDGELTLKKSVFVNNLSYLDNRYYYDGRLASGLVLLDDRRTLAVYFLEGRINRFMALHDNGECAFVFSNLEEIEEEDRYFYDQNGEKISLADFKAKYPKIIPRVKEAHKDLDKLK